MTKDKIQIQVTLGTYLSMKWKEYEKLWEEGSELLEEGWKKLREEENELCEEGWKLCEKGEKLLDAGWKLYRDAVKEVYGDREVEINWFTGEVEIL